MSKIERTPKRRTEATIRDEVRAALGRIPGVTLYDNRERLVKIGDRDVWMPGIGGKGFPDLAGFVTVPIEALYRAGVRDVPVFATMELKMPGADRKHGGHEDGQRGVIETLAGLGTATCGFVHSAEEAEVVVRRWRGGMLR